MLEYFEVHWIVSPLSPPKPVIACKSCGGYRPFAFSGKARLNANGRKLDGWLIYKCSSCDATWKLPVLERRDVGSVAEDELSAFQFNALDYLRRFACDIAVLRKYARGIESADDYEVIVTSTGTMPPALAELRIAITASGHTGVRLDQLLCSRLGISRSRLAGLERSGQCRVEPFSKYALRRPLTGSLTVSLWLQDLPNRREIFMAALGRPSP